MRRSTWSTATWPRAGRRSRPSSIRNETLTYGELQGRCNRMANLLGTYGIPREARVALLLLDTVDFPVAFWGAIKAGVVPVAPQHAADDRAVRLHPRRQPRQGAVRLGAAAARGAADPRPAAVPQAYLRLRRRAHRRLPCRCAASCSSRRRTSRPSTPAATRRRSGSTRRALPACPRACAMCIRARWRRRGCAARSASAFARTTLIYSAAKLFFAYGLGNAMSFPMSVGAAAVLLPERPTPELVFRTLKQHQPTMFFGVPTLYAAMLAYPQGTPENSSQRLRLCVSAGEALPAEVGKAFRKQVRRRRPGRRRLHRDAASVRLQQLRRSALRHLRQAGARLRDPPGRRAGQGRSRRRGRRDAGARHQRRRKATGTSATRAAPPSKAAGRARATSTRATPTASTPTRAAPTTCSRCRASGCRRSRWRAR